MIYTESTWNGFKRLDFQLAEREAILIVPHQPREDGKWLLKTEYFDSLMLLEKALKNGSFFIRRACVLRVERDPNSF